METILKQISKRENQKEVINTRAYMPRVYEVRSPCQWLEHCHDGKCPLSYAKTETFTAPKSKANIKPFFFIR